MGQALLSPWDCLWESATIYLFICDNNYNIIIITWPDLVYFDQVAPWFGLSPSSTLMCPSTQVDKCWYGDWIYIGLVASGGTQQSLFYWKIYDPQTWRYSDLTLTLSSLKSPDHHSGHPAVSATTAPASTKKNSREKEGHQQSLFVLNLNSLVHISQFK